MVADLRDEFGTVVNGFNRMTDELAGLVGQVQKSGLQVTTSVTEIAATSTEISATSRQLVKTMADMATISKVAEQTNPLSLSAAKRTGRNRVCARILEPLNIS